MPITRRQLLRRLPPIACLLAGVVPTAVADDALSLVVAPFRVEAAPGGLADPISITITNHGQWNAPIAVEIKSPMGWTCGSAETPSISPGGSVMVTMFVRAPGLAGAAADTLIITARGQADNDTRGSASVSASRRACIADWNGIDGLNERDLVDFLGDFQRSAADFNGVGGTSVEDIFDFLHAYFDGCR